MHERNARIESESQVSMNLEESKRLLASCPFDTRKIWQMLPRHRYYNTTHDRKSPDYLTIIPRARMGSESIAHEAEGRMGY